MLGLAISGGGLKAIGEIGAMKAFEDLGIKFDAISGTSSGSSVAMLYSLGYTAEESKKIILEEYKKFTTFNLNLLIKGASTFVLTGIAKIGGVIESEKIEHFAEDLALNKGIKNMNELSIPTLIVTVDTITTKEIVFSSKKIDKRSADFDMDFVYDAPVGTAVRASMAFPGIFTNCDYDKYNFIDGGTKNNLPTEPLRVLGAEKIISLSFKMDEYEPKEDLMAIILRTCDIFAFDRLETSKKHSDLNIEINVPEANLLEVKEDKIEECFDAGYNAVMERKEEILKLVNQ